MSQTTWFYRAASGRSSGDFLLMSHSHTTGTSKCRSYDLATGRNIHEYNSRRGHYDSAFGDIIAGCERLPGLPGAKVAEIARHLPTDHLNQLRSQAKLSPIGESSSVILGGPPGGMLNGFDPIVDAALGLKWNFRSKSAALHLSQHQISLDGSDLLDKLYRRIEANWDKSECRSRELWRWGVSPNISDRNTSPEKGLEKQIVNSIPGWVNQIPAASGLLKNCREEHISVDLGRKSGPREFELIELKAGPNADTPVRAAFEIIGYALLYCFARLHLRELALSKVSELLLAKAVYLKVLGPKNVYAGYSLGWLADALDTGLQSFSQQRFAGDLTMRFTFESLPEGLSWPCSDDDLRRALERRSRHVF